MNLFTRVIKSRLNLVRLVYKAVWGLILKIIKYFQFFKISSEAQNQSFQQIHLDRQLGIKKLDKIMLELFGKTYSEHSNGSEHLVLFSSLSLKNQKIKRILEIGTFDGRTALVLSKLFPSRRSLPWTYLNLLTISNLLMVEASPLNCLQMNATKFFLEELISSLRKLTSITLTYKTDKFDLVWVDGSHGYPIAAMDIVNSLRLTRVGGYILIDDIWKTTYRSDKHYKSVGGFESLEALKKSDVIDSYFLINKRLAGQYNYPSSKKYVAIIRKTDQEF